jgi:hypothetical protein
MKIEYTEISLESVKTTRRISKGFIARNVGELEGKVDLGIW